jgi:hypothetical protein
MSGAILMIAPGFEATAKEGLQDQLAKELAELFLRQNQAGPEATVIPATYLKVIVRRI